MGFNEKTVYKIYHVGGRRFAVYLEYEEQLGKSYPVYPDFESCPEYTEDGRPFATAEQESCPHCRPKVPGEPRPCDCGGCGWFYREGTQYDPIGICMCDLKRQNGKDA